MKEDFLRLWDSPVSNNGRGLKLTFKDVFKDLTKIRPLAITGVD